MLRGSGEDGAWRHVGAGWLPAATTLPLLPFPDANRDMQVVLLDLLKLICLVILGKDGPSDGMDVGAGGQVAGAGHL
jgi:hypothetical protein